MAKKVILIDTNILIAYFRGESHIIQELNEVIGFPNLAISTVTVLEMYFGMFKNEERKTKELIRKFNNFYLDKEISQNSIEIMLSNIGKQPSLPDSLIASVAIRNNV